MLKELIDKLKAKKQQLNKLDTHNKNIENKVNEKEKLFDITITKQDNIYKLEISDFISAIDYMDRMKKIDEYGLLNILGNSVLWNSNKQKINKGTYFIIQTDNELYNILITNENIEIDERIKKELDEETGKESITAEKNLALNINDCEYRYCSFRHDKTGSTYHTRYYNKNRAYSLGALDLSIEESFEEINILINNLEKIEGIKNIIDINLIKKYVLDDITKDIEQKKKVL